MKDSHPLSSDACTREAKGQTKSIPSPPNLNYLLAQTFKVEVWEFMSEQFDFLQGEALAVLL